MANRPSFRRWLQVSLKSLFLVTFVVAAFFGGYTLATRHAADTIRAEREARENAEHNLLAELILQTWKASYLQAQGKQSGWSLDGTWGSPLLPPEAPGATPFGRDCRR
jgi:hypothetical protein